MLIQSYDDMTMIWFMIWWYDLRQLSFIIESYDFILYAHVLCVVSCMLHAVGLPYCGISYHIKRFHIVSNYFIWNKSYLITHNFLIDFWLFEHHLGLPGQWPMQPYGAPVLMKLALISFRSFSQLACPYAGPLCWYYCFGGNGLASVMAHDSWLMS